ncbi:MAG: hypothetical protein HC800_17555 [Phormidesmis sp. RL_2_1]|nr:hypothetical protein [Phormidesmis sp. RL_2_1]
MSDTTAYLAGCATTGVAALVLLVARMGMINADTQRSSQLGDRLARIEAAAPSSQPEHQATQQMEFEIRNELDKQRDLTEKLEEQLAKQETLSGSLEAQIKAQEEKTQEMLTKMQAYQRSVEDIELQDKITAASRPAAELTRPSSGPPASILWLGAGVVVVLVLGGGGLLICAVLLILQSQRRSARPAPMPPQMPISPTAPYRYYDQTFLPPAQLRPQRPSYYDYPPSPYDYNS